jgi:hypothetical protein
MLAAPALAETTAPGASPEEARVARAGWRAEALKRLAALCERVAEAEARRVLAAVEAEEAGEAPAEKGRDPALGFARAARAMRETLALSAKLDREQQALEADVAKQAEAAALATGAAPAPASSLSRTFETRHLRRSIRKDEILEIAEQMVDAEHEGAAAENVYGDLVDWVRDEGALRDWDRPIGELLAHICHDLGLTPDWNDWRDEDWAREEAETREASASPFAPPRWRSRGAWEVGVEAAAVEEVVEEPAPP